MKAYKRILSTEQSKLKSFKNKKDFKKFHKGYGFFQCKYPDINTLNVLGITKIGNNEKIKGIF